MKNNYIIENCYTGGGCEHLSVKFPSIGLEFTIMNADEGSHDYLPTNGSAFCFNISKIDEWIDGNYIEVSPRFNNFKRETIGEWCEGYLAAKGYQATTAYDVEDLFSSVNDIYSQYDDGKINKDEATEILAKCCKAFLNN